ncbi:MAG: hypothetical protein AB1847_05405 [bacterium]
MKNSSPQTSPPLSPHSAEQENYRLCFRFEYGPLDDGTLWIRTPNRGLFHVDWLTLRILLELNGGVSVSGAAQKYKVEQQELRSLIVSLEKEGAIVPARQGKITMGRQRDDIHLLPFIFLFLLLAAVQVEYFRTLARTVTLNRGYEGLVIGLFGLLPIILHELGHYLVARSYFSPRLGFTHLLFFPAVYMDTHPAWCLPQNVRLLINSAGLLADLIFNALLVALVLYSPPLEYYVTPLLILQYTRWTIILNPMVNGDGYWLLSDLSKTVNLRQRGRERLVKGEFHWLSLYGLLSLIFSLLSIMGLVWFAANILGKFILPFLR